jgi:hypothetical protein
LSNANALRRLIREYVAPVLVASGYVQRGQTFRFPVNGIDFAVVQLRRETTSPDVVWFDVDVGVFIPNSRPSIPRWVDAPTDTPGIELCNFRARVRSSPETNWSRLSGFNDLGDWGIDLAVGYTTVGEELAAKLKDHVIPLLDRLVTTRSGSPSELTYPLEAYVSQPPFSPFPSDPEAIARLNAAVTWQLDIDLDTYFERE